MNEQHHRPRVAWTVIKTFEKNDIIVEVAENDSSRPGYTARVGRRGETGTIPYLRLFVEGQGRIRVVSIAETVDELLLEAQRFVEARAQEREDKYIAERLEREERQVTREGKKRRPGLKGHNGRAEQ